MPLHSGKIGNGGYTREQVNGGEVGRYNANAGGEKLYNNTFSITTIKQESLGGGSCFFRYIIISGEVNVNVVEKKRKSCIFNRKYHLCNIDMHSSLSCERESPNTPRFAITKLQIHILALFFSQKVLQKSFYLQTLTILKHIYSQKRCNFAPEITTGKLLS